MEGSKTEAVLRRRELMFLDSPSQALKGFSAFQSAARRWLVQGRRGVGHKHVASPHKDTWGGSTVIDEVDKPFSAAAAREPCRRRSPDRSEQQIPVDAENLDSSQSAGTEVQWRSAEEAASTHFEGRGNIMNEAQCMLNSQVSWERQDLKFVSFRFCICVWK